MVIKSFKDKEAEKVFNGYFSKKLPQQIQQCARESLKQLDAAENLNDLLLPPSNVWSNWKMTVKVNTAYGSIKSIAFVSIGRAPTRMKLRLLITTKA